MGRQRRETKRGWRVEGRGVGVCADKKMPHTKGRAACLGDEVLYKKKGGRQNCQIIKIEILLLFIFQTAPIFFL